jgi:hypothetical protein
LTRVSIAVFDRERDEGVVNAVSWLISRRIAHGVLEDFVAPFLFSVVFYFMCGFDTDASMFFRFYAVVLINQFIAVSLAAFSVSLSRDFPISSMIGNLM